MPLFLLTLLLPATLVAQVSGRVVDPAGKPLRDVRIWPASVDEETHAKGPRAVTGADGRFEIPERILDPEVELSLCLDGYVPERVRPAWFDGTVVLRPAARITGKVTDPAGRPLAGARVQERFQLLQRKPVNAPFDPCRKDGGVAVSGPDGRYTLEGLEPGSYILSIHAPGWLRATTAPVTAPPAGTAEAPAVALAEGAVVQGRVLDPQGKPAAGIQVFEFGGSVYEQGPAKTVTDAEGRFRLEGVLPGMARIAAHSEDLGRPRAEATLPVSRDPSRLELRLEPLNPAPMSATRPESPTVEVSGRVTGPKGEPVVSAAIWIQGLGDLPSRAGYTREDGTFSLRLAENVYRVTVERPGYARTRVEYLEVGTRPTPPTPGVEIRMEKGIPVQGRVVLPPGVRIPSVLVKSGSFLWRVPVSRDGSFEDELGPGEWEVEADFSRQESGRTAKARVVLEPGEPAPALVLDLALGEQTLAGRFVKGYTAQRGVRLVRRSPAGAELQALPSDGSDRFVFYDLAPGAYTLQVYEICCNSKAKVVHEQFVSVPSNETVLVELQ